ncbi:MAG: lysophospholipase L1-like esterase [Myxococcota bacterium]|jgi:lysophospholipase L1-like esterase
MTRFKRALQLVLANVILWVVLELIALAALSALVDEPEPKDDRDWLYQAKLSFKGGLYVWDEQCLWTLQPGYESPENPGRQFWGDGPLRINANGHRGPDRPIVKPAGVKRVLIVGGSHPMGMYVSYADSYGAVLEAELNRAPEGVRWEVLNASAPGHTSFQGLQYLKFHSQKFEPDIVLMDLGVNDTLPLSAEFPLPDHQVKRPPAWAADARNWLRVSAVYRLMKHMLRPKPAPATELDENGPGQRVPTAQHHQNLADATTIAGERGIQLLHVTQFSVDLHGSHKANCIFPSKEHVPLVDICTLWTAMGPGAAAYFVDPIHANAAGHRLIGDAIFKRLDALGWTR